MRDSSLLVFHTHQVSRGTKRHSRDTNSRAIKGTRLHTFVTRLRRTFETRQCNYESRLLTVVSRTNILETRMFSVETRQFRRVSRKQTYTPYWGLERVSRTFVKLRLDGTVHSCVFALIFVCGVYIPLRNYWNQYGATKCMHCVF